LGKGFQITREFTYIDKHLPFKAISMGKKNDEYFLDKAGQKIPNRELIDNLTLLTIKEFKSQVDLSFEHKQANKATLIADLYLTDDNIEIIIELEVFKDKPFSNLIFIPQVCLLIEKNHYILSISSLLNEMIWKLN
jgi:hypothetical protein